MFGKYGSPQAEAVVHLIAGLSYDMVRRPCATIRQLTVVARELRLDTAITGNPQEVVLYVSGSLIEADGQIRNDVVSALTAYFTDNNFKIVAARISGRKYMLHMLKP